MISKIIAKYKSTSMIGKVKKLGYFIAQKLEQLKPEMIAQNKHTQQVL